MKKIYLDDMLLTKAYPTSAGSKMLDGYMSLFDTAVLEKLVNGGCEIAGKLPVGEFAIDLVGETNYNGQVKREKLGEGEAAVCFDVNGSPRRIAAQGEMVFVKPTYGTVSRFGAVAIACSGECVGVMAGSAKECGDVLSLIVGKDERDGTMHSDEVCRSALAENSVKRVAVLDMDASDEIKAKLDAVKADLADMGIEAVMLDAGAIAVSNSAWNILMCAELCNNVSRFDGIKYGYRSPNYKNLDELYTNSRTEAFGDLAKTAILYGSDVLSSPNYLSKYDKSMRVRRVICEAFAEIFKEYDAVLLPACSKMSYTAEDDPFVENKYTAPASISGLPAVAFDGVQLMGKAFSDGTLLKLASEIRKEGK